MILNYKAGAVSSAGLLISLGIIYGDIGTSPLYVMKAIIGENPISGILVYGGISCVFWTLTLQTTFKYVLLTLQADNKGEGGIFSLYTLISRRAPWLIVPAMIGGSALVANGEVDITSRYVSLSKQHLIGDFRFVVLEKFLSYENDLPFRKRLIMEWYFNIKQFTSSESKWFGLDSSSVKV